MSTAAKILEGINWSNETVQMISEISTHLNQQGKLITDLELWLNAWEDYRMNNIDQLLFKKARKIKQLKSRIENCDFSEKRKLNYSLEQESKMLVILNSVNVFFKNIISASTHHKDLIENQIESIKKENKLIFSTAEKFEMLFNQSTAGETILSELNIELLRENEALKQQIKKLTNQSK